MIIIYRAVLLKSAAMVLYLATGGMLLLCASIHIAATILKTYYRQSKDNEKFFKYLSLETVLELIIVYSLS